MKLRRIIVAILAMTSVQFSAQILALPPTPDVNVVNTVDANLVTTISTEGLIGLELGPLIATGIVVVFPSEVKLLSISTSIAPDVPGEICNFTARASTGESTSENSLGFSAMSNGQAANLSRHYVVPIGPVTRIEWLVSGTTDECWASLSAVAEPVESTGNALSEEFQGQVRLEIR